MERLTRKVDGKIVFPSELVGVTLTPDNVVLHELLCRLADYEDTRLTPKEVAALQKDYSVLWASIGECGGIDRVMELAKADMDGRVLVLPCKEGARK